MQNRMEAELCVFNLAQPVWLKNMQQQMNILAGFRVMIHMGVNQEVICKIAASCTYRFYVNGNFAGHGPAVATHGYYRIDEWDIRKYLHTGKNMIAIEVAGYNVNSFYTLNQPSFVQAEVIADGIVIAATGSCENSFAASILTERLQRVQRYSFQRPFAEAYEMNPGYSDWRSDENGTFKVIPWEKTSQKKFLSRRVKYPEFETSSPQKHISKGMFRAVENADIWRDRSLTNIGPQLKGFKEEELEIKLSEEATGIAILTSEVMDCSYEACKRMDIGHGTYQIVDFTTNLSGFIGCDIICDEASKILFLFDEILTGETIDFKRNSCVNVISCEMSEGKYKFESMEPYTLKYLQILVIKGKCRIGDIYVREYVNPDVREAEFECSDDRLNLIFDSGRNTFKQNAVDTFMDCPSRERAGWLCDSFFTSRVANDLSGNTLVETNFYENYLLIDKYPDIPDGMLPMCYPSDHYDGVYIPQWALWFIVQLEEFADRTEDITLVNRLEGKVFKLFAFLKKYINEHGLLEKLEGWQFIEWSKANDFVNDVNYPTNMLYAAALNAAGRLYGYSELTNRAQKIRDVVLEQSFNGEFFRDNAIRINGRLVPQENYTEVCQYYAFFFGIATDKAHGRLLDTLVEKFGPARKSSCEFSKVYPANAFIGYYLRFEILSAYHQNGLIIKELCDYFLDMAVKTGTLWEHNNEAASLNHGFASHVVHILYRDVLGVDVSEKEVHLHFHDVSLKECKGCIPVPEGEVYFWWVRGEKQIKYSYSVPDGYKVIIENESGKSLSMD